MQIFTRSASRVVLKPIYQKKSTIVVGVGVGEAKAGDGVGAAGRVQAMAVI
jgi:hypothetical protein